MKTSDLELFLGAKCVQSSFKDREIEGAYASDLLSDAIANAMENGLLITIQAHKNTVAVATLKDLAAIILCNDRPVPYDMIEAARAEGIAIFLTSDDQYTVSGKLYKKLNP